MSAARCRSRELKAMWAIASTTGTIPGFLTMSMCSIVRPRYLPLSASSLALSGLVLSVLSAMMRLLLIEVEEAYWKIKKATTASYDVSLTVRQPPLRAGVAFKQNVFYDGWYANVKSQFAPTGKIFDATRRHPNPHCRFALARIVKMIARRARRI